MQRKMFKPVTMLRLLLVVGLYLGASLHMNTEIEILDNTKFSLFITAGLDFLLFMCWMLFSFFGLYKFMEWVDTPTEAERDEQVIEFENLLRKHFPSLQKQADEEKK